MERVVLGRVVFGASCPVSVELVLTRIYFTSHCRKTWSRLASNSRNLPFLPAASRNPGHVMEQAAFQLYRTRIGICLSYQQQAGTQGTKLPLFHHRCRDGELAADNELTHAQGSIMRIDAVCVKICLDD